MKFGRSGRMFWATAAASVCLLGVVSAQQAAQEPAPLMAEEHFTTLQVLKGMPVDTFMDAMGMFAASMGGDCTYCHSKKAVLDRTAFAEQTPRIQRARQMIVMMNALNKNYFGGAPRVTCFTCHRGAYKPETAPRLALQYGTPPDDPDVMEFVEDTKASADKIFDRYLEALGGAGRLAKISSFAAKGTYAGFDTGFDEVPVDIFGKAPNQRAMFIHMDYGENVRVFDGRNGWFAGPDSPAPLVTLTGGNLDVARMEAMVAFPSGIRRAFGKWIVGNSLIDDKEVQIVQGANAGQLPLNLYFDTSSGLLVRMVRWNTTAVGPVPTQIDYSDYRDVAGVKMPFTWTVSQTYMQMTIKLSDLQPNVAIDAGRFARPAPGQPRAPAKPR